MEDGKEIKILRDNMPFGRVGGEFGTYFIGYSRSPGIIEQMLKNMFIGKPPGNYDRLLDFSRAVTGNLFFVPSATFLDNVTADEPPTRRFPSRPALSGFRPTHRRRMAHSASVHSKESTSMNNLHRGPQGGCAARCSTPASKWITAMYTVARFYCSAPMQSRLAFTESESAASRHLPVK